MTYEKPQKTNPNKITVKQHVFPRASIARFANTEGNITTFYIPNKKKIVLTPSNEMFCARRVWNQVAEAGYIKSIEDRFQILASAISSGTLKEIQHSDQPLITGFFHLCRLRAQYKKNPINDITNPVSLSKPTLTKDQHEILEKNGYVYFYNEIIPRRHLTGIAIQAELIAIRRIIDIPWGIIRTTGVELIVSDNFYDFDEPIIPISPTIFLTANTENKTLTVNESRLLNLQSIFLSSEYYFARNFARCLG